MPRLIPRHMLYTVVDDKTEVDKEIVRDTFIHIHNHNHNHHFNQTFIFFRLHALIFL